MRVIEVQSLLLKAGYYKGALDDDYGPKTEAAVAKLLDNRRDDLSFNPERSSRTRRLIAAGQIVLKYAGYNPGIIDGYSGHNTQNAYREWAHEALTGQKLVLDQTPQKDIPSTFPHQNEAKSFYGDPAIGNGRVIQDQLDWVSTYDMRLDWQLRKKVSRIKLHEKCAASAEQAFSVVLSTYGQPRLTALGLDRFAGSYNHRPMRGGSRWSMHAYGCAIDFYAAPNGLTTRCPKALFCDPEYKEFFDIWEGHGWISLGRAIGRDWMHLQAARI